MDGPVTKIDYRNENSGEILQIFFLEFCGVSCVCLCGDVRGGAEISPRIKDRQGKFSHKGKADWVTYRNLENNNNGNKESRRLG